MISLSALIKLTEKFPSMMKPMSESMRSKCWTFLIDANISDEISVASSKLLATLNNCGGRQNCSNLVESQLDRCIASLHGFMDLLFRSFVEGSLVNIL